MSKVALYEAALKQMADTGNELAVATLAAGDMLPSEPDLQVVANKRRAALGALRRALVSNSTE